MELVQPGLLTDEGTATQLRELLAIAVPRPQHDDINADFLLMLARLAPGLHAFALVAETASVHWRGKARPGGRQKDRARRHLMAGLCSAYETMFGTAATVTVRFNKSARRAHAPGGQSLDWFVSLFRLIGNRLPVDESTRPVRAILDTALRRSDALPNWLRAATAERNSLRKTAD
jgi:hypothetical protein